MTESEVDEEAKDKFSGDVRRVLNILRVTVVCHSGRDAANCCRQLKANSRVRLRSLSAPLFSVLFYVILFCFVRFCSAVRMVRGESIWRGLPLAT